MAAIRHLCPQFLEENRLCWLRSPLYIVKNGGKETYYFTDEEYAAASPKGETIRAKGLGSLDSKTAKNSMFGENQRLDVMEADDEAIALLESLMGEDIEPRKKYIFDNVDFSTIRE